MSNQKESFKINNAPYLKIILIVVCCILFLFIFCIPFVLFPFYEGRNPNYYDYGDMSVIIFGEILTLILGIYLLFVFSKEAWQIEISSDYITLRNIWKKERKYLLRNIKTIDKIRFHGDIEKIWAIIGKKSYKKKWYKNEIDNNKIPLIVRDKVGIQIKSIFEQYKHKQNVNK